MSSAISGVSTCVPDMCQNHITLFCPVLLMLFFDVGPNHKTGQQPVFNGDVFLFIYFVCFKNCF